MVEFEEYKGKINALHPTLEVLRGALNLDQAEAEIARLEAESAVDGFWNDVENSQKVMQKINQLKSKCEKFRKLESGWDDLMTLCQMGIEEDDDSLLEELTEEYDSFEKALEEARLATLLTGEYDANNAILNFHAGAGGTEAQDWTQMLYACTPAGRSATTSM
jgi:peptide chain release factor 2